MIEPIVTVIVDRPLGSCHPEHPDLIYPVNYGFVKGTLAADGEEQDAYIVGVYEPILEFTGRIIAVIYRQDDVENKWVVAPEGRAFTIEEIKEMTFFQEQYFNSKVVLL